MAIPNSQTAQSPAVTAAVRAFKRQAARSKLKDSACDLVIPAYVPVFDGKKHTTTKTSLNRDSSRTHPHSADELVSSDSDKDVLAGRNGIDVHFEEDNDEDLDAFSDPCVELVDSGPGSPDGFLDDLSIVQAMAVRRPSVSSLRRRNSTGSCKNEDGIDILADIPRGSPSQYEHACPPTPANTPTSGSLSRHPSLTSQHQLMMIRDRLAQEVEAPQRKGVTFAPSVSVHTQKEWIRRLHGYRKARKRLNRWRLTSLFATEDLEALQPQSDNRAQSSFKNHRQVRGRGGTVGRVLNPLLEVTQTF
ncbi:hypothetical protein HKX48_001907 [Thoreauomyces humboldtii]|nr:hypothetical protein HKX48_001907 [Thoreauomyces humboldtii]